MRDWFDAIPIPEFFALLRALHQRNDLFYGAATTVSPKELASVFYVNTIFTPT